MTSRKWWKEKVIYQIYPRSFKDSNADGIGDLQGIIEKVDYLESLGIDVIWLGPVYDSPNDDNGYDIRDYLSIHEEFGTMDDFDQLLNLLHERDIKLIMDLVVNHTSDEHYWFKESRKSIDNKFRGFYIWKKGVNGGPPNNWTSFFGGSAWQYDELTDEYYLHIFTKKQPDLNWENVELRNEIKNIIKYWLEKGIDGFRMDVIPLISKRQNFPDSPYEKFGDTVKYIYSNGPRVHEYINELYEDVISDYDVFTVGEGPGISTDIGLSYVDEDRRELNMIFHLDHMFLGFGNEGRFDQHPYGLNEIRKIFNDWDRVISDKGWLSIFMDNHDFVRMVSRFGNDRKFREESAKLLGMLVLTLRGTPCIYQGSELGMTNVKYDSISEFRDVETLNFYEIFTQSGMSNEEFIELANTYGRDNARTPMQWNKNKNAGFSETTPWISVNPNFDRVNVELAESDENSILNFYKKLLALRKNNETLIYGEYHDISQEVSSIFLYTRTLNKEVYTIALNFSDDTIKQSFKKYGELVLCNYGDEVERMRPWEARLYKQKKSKA